MKYDVPPYDPFADRGDDYFHPANDAAEHLLQVEFTHRDIAVLFGILNRTQDQYESKLLTKFIVVEFLSLDEIRARFGPDGVRELAPACGRAGAITDDTQMTLFTAEGLVLAARAGVLDRTDEVARIVHRAYLRWLRTQGGTSAHPTFERANEGWLLDVAELHAVRAPGSTCGTRGSPPDP